MPRSVRMLCENLLPYNHNDIHSPHHYYHSVSDYNTIADHHAAYLCNSSLLPETHGSEAKP
jgi:hypothetical protein